MDYYQRKEKAQTLIKELLKRKHSIKEIQFSVEDTYQLSPKWTAEYIERLQAK